MPDNPFRAYREQQGAAANPFRTYREQQAEKPSANYVAREMAARGTLNNLMAVPGASGDLLANALNAAGAGAQRVATAGGRNIKSVLPFMEPSPTTPSFGDIYAERTGTEGPVQRALRNIPRPTVEDVTAGVNSIPSLLPGGETPGEAMERNRADYRRDEFEMREAHPTAAVAGDVGGDVLSLFVGRRGTGAGRAMQRLETRLAGKTGIEVAESLGQDLGKIMKSPAMQRLARGSARSLEAGIEAAALDILKDPNADPAETAAIAAGGQLVGSGTLALSKGLLSGGPANAGLKVTVAAVSTMGILQMLKSAAPGGEDRILESVESGFDKVLLTLGLGVGSAALGATRYGRGNVNLADQTRTYLDGLSTVHRGTTLSLLSDWTEGDSEDRAAIERVLTAMASNPTYRGENSVERRIVSRIRTGAGLERYESGGGF